MVRIFLSLAVFAVVLLLTTLVLGLALGDFGASVSQYSDAVRRHSMLSKSESALDAEIAEAEMARKDALEKLVAMRQRFRPHIWLGIASALVTVLVNCISVTYFVGTSRWCREVVEAYGLDWEFAERSRRLKRRCFPFAVLGMLTIVGVIALGGAADPGGSVATAAQWVIPHFLAAMLGTVVIAVAFYVQVNTVAANYEVIQLIMAEAQRIRSLSSSNADVESIIK